jgi:hypothetical protein
MGTRRLGIGDSTGKEQRTRTYSKRAAKGKLDVINKRCPFCHHHKALKTINYIKCSKCKRKVIA